MADRDKKGRIMSKTEKMKELASMKVEDVEFAALEADADDVEAIRRSEESDNRQLRKMNDGGWNEL
ncbi:YfhD family protein [Paenibacillus pini]|uniref:YfhD family protein n=1 Tax=Paenibacillus pini JCM 16418 TaxID=1236976 RepID=W7YX80_9BACL|nr:YfhD family protein [Paenibacillus pini]GAF07009.1 hypothetical protein JCM16418_996 [Paenibacillus pini JCM 16418]